MNARFRFAGLLLPVVLLGCNGMETRVTDSVKPGEVAIAPRFVSASAVPRVDRLNVTLAVPGRTDMVNDVAHSPGSTMVLGSVPVGSAYTVTALGYDTAADKKVERFWGKTSGKADSQSDATVVIALETGPTAPTAQADSLVVGGKLALSPGMWYTLDGSDPRAGTAISANGPITIDKAGTVKAAHLTPADPGTGTPALWSAVSSWTFAVAGSVVSKDTSLSGLTASPIVGSLVPEFTSVTLSYEATVDTGVTSVTVVGTPKLSGAQVSYGNGLSSGVVNLGTRTADTALEVTVTNGGKSMVYTVTLKRKTYGNTSVPSAFGIPWNTASGITYDSVIHQGQTYRTVKIGSQTWMAENLNDSGEGSKGRCYGNSLDSCAKYGRLYTWAETMNSASSSLANPSGVQGVCPADWHVPSDAEWTELENALDVSGVADGTKLKSTIGWNGTGSGTDEFGFRALPAGANGFNGTVGDQGVGLKTWWWSATEVSASTNEAATRYATWSAQTLSPATNPKMERFSVRCVRNPAPVVPEPSYTMTALARNGKIVLSAVGPYDAVTSVTATATPDSGFSFSGWSGACLGTGACVVVVKSDTSLTAHFTPLTGSGNFVDDRDDQPYKSVRIGNQVWMAQNLNFQTSGSSCYQEDTSACTLYGRLYSWADAMALDDSCNTKSCSTEVKVKHQGACPAGWHVPSDGEWATLTETTLESATAGTKLKATSGLWNTNTGTDDYDFAALPAGQRGLGGTPEGGGLRTAFWSTSEYTAYKAMNREVTGTDAKTNRLAHNKLIGISVRCIQD